MALQLAGLLLAGAATVREFDVWAEIDERAHFSYIQYVAEDQRLPVLGVDEMGEEIRAIAQGTYPGPPSIPASRDPLGGQSYEAFQPPLYYLLAAPVFLVNSETLAKVDWVRAFDLLLLLAAAGALYLLARQAFGRDDLLPFAGGLAVLLFPGVLVRGVTVSNTALELPLALLFLAVLWRADAGGSRRALLGAGTLLGLALLTKLTLAFLIPLYAVVLVRNLRRHAERRLATALGAVLIPALLLAPWTAFNLHHYDSLSANERARDMQSAAGIPPERSRTGTDVLPEKNWNLTDAFLPQEWDSKRNRMSALVDIVGNGLKLVFFGLPALLLAIRPGLLRTREFGLLVAPVLLGVLMINLTLLVEDWDIFLARYFYPVLPAFGLFAVVAWRRLLRSNAAALALTAAVTLALGGLWLYLGGYFYYPTSLGDTLGIG